MELIDSLLARVSDYALTVRSCAVLGAAALVR